MVSTLQQTRNGTTICVNVEDKKCVISLSGRTNPELKKVHGILNNSFHNPAWVMNQLLKLTQP